VQIGIFLLGTGMVWFSADERARVRLVGCVCGLLSQPFWFYASYKTEQWGAFAMSFVFLAVWSRNFRNNWKLLQ
jgi:hypothetical protein